MVQEELPPEAYEWVTPEVGTTTEEYDYTAVANGNLATSFDPIAHSCVKYVRSRGIPVPMGMDAKYFSTLPKMTPKLHGVIIFKYTKDFHVAFIEKLSDKIYIAESNFEEGEYTRRAIDFNDPFIYGFWNP